MNIKVKTVSELPLYKFLLNIWEYSHLTVKMFVRCHLEKKTQIRIHSAV